MSGKVRFIDAQKSQFYSTVRGRVNDYFKEQRLSKNANALMYFKTTFFLGGLIFIYCLILSNKFNPLFMFLLAILLGMFTAFVGFNVCHDAIHGAYSSKSYVNRALGYVFNILGANAYVWNISHNIIHHTYTNISGHDGDIEIAPGLIRVTHEDKIFKIQMYQHIYAFLLYGFASLAWVFNKDYQLIHKNNLGGLNLKHPQNEIVKMYFFKAVYYFLFIVLPLLILKLSWWQFIIGFVAMHLVEGWIMGIVFQLAHVVEDSDFPIPTSDGNIEEAWAVHQMRTTANFSKDNGWITWFCGGLNMQIEHHLFPKICHVHYPKISVIVEQTAKEFNVPYLANKTIFDAVRSHYKMLRKFGVDAQGNQDKVVDNEFHNLNLK
ncbi:MAG: acyl-CoA desaturase [Sporocytophaga sp.]|nr:acyl-CoA desaturase [Sporocytophaga sp.]